MSHTTRHAVTASEDAPPAAWLPSACGEDTCCELVTSTLGLDASESLALGVALSRTLAGDSLCDIVREVLLRAAISFLTHHLFAWLATVSHASLPVH